jgi:hypothetical protein
MASNTLVECPIVLSPSQNDLYSCLDTFFFDDPTPFTLAGGALPSNTEIIVVRISRDIAPRGPMELPLSIAVAAALSTTGQPSVGEQKEPFRYPAVLQMDRWFAENHQAAIERQNQLKKLRANMRDLLRRLDVLSGPKARLSSWHLPPTAHHVSI